MNPCFSYFQCFALIDNAELPVNIFTHVYLQTSASISVEHIHKREMLSKVYVNLCSVSVFYFIYAFLRATHLFSHNFCRTGIWNVSSSGIHMKL